MSKIYLAVQQELFLTHLLRIVKIVINTVLNALINKNVNSVKGNL